MASASAAAISNARVLRIALPIVVSNATVPILGAVDTAVVGQLGQAAPIGAVGLGAIVLVSIYWIFGFLRMGTTGLVAQARGAGDAAETSALLTRGLMIAFVAGAVIIAAQALIFRGAFRIAPASAEVEGLARQYLSIRVWGAPAAIGAYALTGWLIAMERGRAVLMLQLFTNGVNVALSVSFVLGLGWGVPGVALGTLIAEWSGLAFGLLLCGAAFAGARWRDWPRVFDTGKLGRMARVNGDIMIRSVALQGCFTAFIFFGAGLGDVSLAANQVLLQFLEIIAYALDGFAFAAEALVGQALGHRAAGEVRAAALLASKWGLGFAAVLSALFLLAGPSIIDVMTTSEEVRAAARRYLPWLVAAPLVSVGAWMLDGIFIGATQTRDMRNAALISAGVYALAVAALTPLLGNHGLWAAILILNLTRGVTLGLRYPRIEARA